MAVVFALIALVPLAAAEQTNRDFNVLVTARSARPAAAPVPRFRYALLPPDADRTAGNAAVEYLRAAAALPADPRLDTDAWREREERHQNWLNGPLRKLPTDEVRRELLPYRRTLEALDRAARMARCEWDVPRPLTLADGVSEEFSKLRQAVQWLRFRHRLELAEGRTADALRSVQTAAQTARDMSRRPGLMGNLVALAFAATAHTMAADTLAADGSPNLYWALAALPDPLVLSTPAVTGEREMIRSALPVFPAFAAGPVSDAEAVRLVIASRANLRVMRMFPFRDSEPKTWPGRVNEWADDFAVIWQAGPARDWLTARGRTDAAAMPPVQAVYLAAWMRYEEAFDTAAAPLLVSTARAADVAAHADRELAALLLRYDDDRLFAELVRGFASGLPKVIEAHLRCRRQWAMLQAGEALRLHLAEHGRWPADWSRLTAVPVPHDPVTGKPFEYAVRDDVAVLFARPRPGQPAHKGTNLRYEIRAR